MESRGCFVDALRAVFSSIRDKIRKRGVKQRRRNYRISKMQAIEKMDQERGRGLKATLRPEVEVVKSRAKTDQRRARLVASGWKPRGEEGEVIKSKVQEKMDTTLQDFQESRKPQRVQLRAQRQKHLDDTKTLPKEETTAEVLQVQVEASVETSSGRVNTKTNTLTCLPLRGKKACSQKWQDTVLEGIPVVQDNMGKRCVPVDCILTGMKACSQTWQDAVLEGIPVVQDNMGKQSSFCDGEEEPMEKREQEMSLAEQEEHPVPVEISTDSSSPTLSQVQTGNTDRGEAQGMTLFDLAETHCNNSDRRWLGPVNMDGLAERRLSDLTYEQINDYLSYNNMEYDADDGHLSPYCSEATGGYSYIYSTFTSFK